MKVWMKIQRVSGGNGTETIVAACDEELIGKTIGHLNVSETFFKGKLVPIEDAITALETATIGNIIGKNVTNAALKRKLVSKEGIKKIKDVLHAQIFLM